MAGFKKSIVLGLDIDEFEKNAKKAQEDIKDIGKASQDAGEDIGGAGAATDLFSEGISAVVDVAGVFRESMNVVSSVISAVIAEMHECVNVGAEYASQMSDLADNRGWSTEAAQEWAMLAEQTGTSIDTLTSGFKDLEKSMDSANHGNKQAKLAFSELGVAVTDSKGKLRDSQAVFLDVVDGLNKMTDSTKKSQLGSEMFGSSYEKLNGIIKKGSAGIKEAKEEMKGFLSEDEIEALNNYSEAMATFQANIELVKSHLGAVVAEVITPFIDALNQIDPEGVANGIVFLANAAKELFIALTPITQALDAIYEAFKMIKPAIDDVVEGFKALKGNSIGDIAKWVVTGNDSYIGHNASGSESWRGGLTWVGEEGPELVNIPTGSTIYNNSESTNMAGNTYNITMNCDISQLKSVSDVVDAVTGLSNSRRGLA